MQSSKSGGLEGVTRCRSLFEPNVKVVFLSSIISVERLVQLWYLQPIITQYFIDNKSEIWLLFLIAHSKR